MKQGDIMDLVMREALKIGKLKEGTLMAGEKGLDNIVTCIDVMEVPDPDGKWFKEGMLLLTMGYAMKDDINMQVEIIETLAEKRAAGIIIKINRFISKVPDEVIKRANELGLPVISLPSHIPYVDVTFPLTGYIIKLREKEQLTEERIKSIMDKSDAAEERHTISKLRELKPGLCLKSPFTIVKIYFRFQQDIKRTINFEKIHSLASCINFTCKGSLILFISGNQKHTKKMISEEILKESFYENENLLCLVGEEFNSICDFKKELAFHDECGEIIKRIIREKNLIFIEEYYAAILIKQISERKITQKIIKKALRPLLKLESQESEIMLETLYYYTKYNGNKTQAAKESYMHRNTFNYRMEKLSAILNSDLQDPDEIYRYRLLLETFFMFNSSANIKEEI